MNKIAWAAWALIPVGALAFHYGPGQAFYQQDVAASLERETTSLERDAQALQDKAHELHVAALEARSRALVLDTAEATSEAKSAGEAEQAAFKAAGAAWKKVADRLGEIQDESAGAPASTLRQLGYARGRALVRAGDIWGGIGELEQVMAEAEEADGRDCELALASRQEMARAHYYGARLMRLSGEPESAWLEQTAQARQHFRYLAEHGTSAGLSTKTVEDHQRDVEVVLNLEQLSMGDLEGDPLPRESPGQCSGDGPPKKKKGKGKRPGQGDARGAGGADQIGAGW